MLDYTDFKMMTPDANRPKIYIDNLAHTTAAAATTTTATVTATTITDTNAIKITTTTTTTNTTVTTNFYPEIQLSGKGE